MKVCVVGAGSIGGMLAVKFAQLGADVCIVDQGPHLHAIERNGLRLIMADGTQTCARNLRIASSNEELQPSDLIILGVKAHQIADVAPRLPYLYRDDTAVVTIQNGIPWWYFQKHGGVFDGTCLKTLDPDGLIAQFVPPERIVGGVAYPACAVTEPGVIHHIEGYRFAFGEIDGSSTRRVAEVSDIFRASGFKSYVMEDIRSEIWLKAWGALAFNPISALTRATMVEMCQSPETRHLAARMMTEAQEIAAGLGISFRHTIEKRIAGAESVGAHKTSMLQDVEAGRSLEIEAIIGSMVELAKITNTTSPAIDAVYACVRLLDQSIQQHIHAPSGKSFEHDNSVSVEARA